VVIVKQRAIKFITHLLLVEVRPGSLRGAWEELPELLKPDEPPSLGSEREDDTAVGQAAKVLDHAGHLKRNKVGAKR
jgi:hypothetical protein